MFMGGYDNMVAEDGGVEKSAAEAGDEGESEAPEKYEQISKSPGHWCIICRAQRIISDFEFRISNFFESRISDSWPTQPPKLAFTGRAVLEGFAIITL